MLYSGLALKDRAKKLQSALFEERGDVFKRKSVGRFTGEYVFFEGAGGFQKTLLGVEKALLGI